MSNVVRRGRGEEYQAWEAPQVGDRRRKPTKPTNDTKAIHDDAQAKGFAQGHAEGLQTAQTTVKELGDRLESIMAALEQPLAAADARVIEKISSLAISLAKRLVRRELSTDRAEVVGVVREALAVLPVGLTGIRLHLHPEDAKLVSEMLVPAKGEAAWQIIEDPVITRGGCRVSSPSSQVDATVQTRLTNVINTMLGGERDEDVTAAKS